MLNQGYRFRSVVASESDNQSLVNYLAEHFSHSSQETWQQRLDQGEVYLNGVPAFGEERLRSGQVVDWNRPGWMEKGAPCHFEVIYRDQELLAVTKPSGLPTLPGAGYFENTLLHLVRKIAPEARPLHRLGRATSGIVLFALNKDVTRELQRSWPLITKEYLALAAGIAACDRYDIRTPIGPVDHPRLGKVHAASDSGKSARSVASVVERTKEATLFRVELFSGRPHQIRIHMASIGHPLVGDPLYAMGGVPKRDQPGLPGDGGYFLHANKMVLHHPVSGSLLELVAPEPFRDGL